MVYQARLEVPEVTQETGLVDEGQGQDPRKDPAQEKEYILKQLNDYMMKMEE